ncbi:MAG: sulfatase [Planctomycetes bacterium]|nr:sulfatase [Planctomycetota bacterium]
MRCTALAASLALAAGSLAGQDASKDRAGTPNIVLIFIDDLGYADIAPFGSKVATPNLDRLAREGRRFTDFLVPSAVCSASRAALLTGCYNRRVGISGALGPRAEHGIAAGETTLAELCKQKGYATACYGKWHLGHNPKFLPLQHGFDDYFGLPYSNDMWPLHPAYAHLPTAAERRKQGYPDLPLIAGDAIAKAEVTGDDQKMLTTWYTEHAVAFIDEHADEPFLLYVPHSMVHVPLFVSDKFAGKSGAGLFGDVVMEVDWSVGEILGALDRHEIADDTLVIFTADNGPWLSYGNHAGSAGPFREGKGTMFEGGIREPTIMRWPGRIPAGTTCGELCSTIDVVPTVARLIGAKLPNATDPAHTIDGCDITPLMFGAEDARSPHAAFWCYYAGGQLQAVRDRRFKLHLPHHYRTLAGRPGGMDGTPANYEQAEIGQSLFDLENDPGETTDVQQDHPDVVARLLAAAEAARADLGDTLTKRVGKGVRPADRLGPDDARLFGAK